MHLPDQEIKEQPAKILLLPLAIAGWVTEAIISPVINFFDYVGRLTIMTGQALWFIVTLRIPYHQTINQMAHLGSDSMFIVTMCVGFTGMILATILAQQAIDLGFGAEYVGGAVVYAMATDLVPVLGGLVMAGRIGAGISSEIGTMVVTEQVDALRALAVPPVRHLVVPRLLACAVMVPVICFIAGFVGVWAGWIPLQFIQGATVNKRIYFDSVANVLNYKLLWVAARKCLYFGLIIALIPCLEGFATRGGAKGVGVTVTRAVVISMVSIFIADLILTIKIESILQKIFSFFQ
ncbi:MAG TPA: ABC transporter permease [bacterium]|jgi:phospholipid/cholesterol/gamma-HCH transport system permease protein